MMSLPLLPCVRSILAFHQDPRVLWRLDSPSAPGVLADPASLDDPFLPALLDRLGVPSPHLGL